MIIQTSPTLAPTVLVGHSERLVRHAIREALRAHGCEVLGTPHAAEVRDAVATYRPEVFVGGDAIDGARDGMALIEELAEDHSVPGVLVLREPSPRALAALRSPYVFGCLAWPPSSAQLIATITSAAAHRECLERERRLGSIRDRLRELSTDLERTIYAPAEEGPASPLAQFSPREREVLELLLAHKRTRTIASRLGISPSTVRNHLKSMFAKTGVGSQEELLESVMRAPLSADRT